MLRKYFKYMQENLELGKRLTKAREDKGLNKSQLAKLVESSGTSINNIETGETKNPSATLLARIASTLGVEYDWLLYGKQNKGSEATYSAANQTNTTNQQGTGNQNNSSGDCETKLAVALAKIEALEQRLVDKDNVIQDRDNQIIFLKSLLPK